MCWRYLVYQSGGKEMRAKKKEKKKSSVIWNPNVSLILSQNIPGV